ncbi:MAG: SDR family NAD(P)-dependent oxidoreductase [Peptococcaceae bacterium]|jgi:NAD(P)-dependent dehydrogenase (short-subunit alcohol dehydrogenase family)|nr:SDR family NAD(P)-dependent oxidoreductase [Peptococcaceae bacterium]
MKLDQVHAVVTGGASGMGKATVQALIAEGGKVCIVDYNKEWGEELAKSLGANAYFEFADVSDPARAEEIVKGAKQKFGYVNVVVTCAGVGSGTRVLPRGGGVFPLDTFKRVLDINLVGTFNYTCQGALAMTEAPGNEDDEHGVIINCSSLAASGGQIGQAAYAASKSGVNAMVLPIARELARVGIRVNAIAPGLISTNIIPVDMENRPKVRRDEMPEDPNNPMAKDFIFPKRQGRATDFSSLVLEVIRNTLINGAVLPLDGAIRFSPKW